MSDIILHNYPESLYSEKIRLILGHKNLAWKSVIIPMVAPKPDLMPLTGGYRRTPVLQIGADVYCDTALIAEVLERIAHDVARHRALGESLSVRDRDRVWIVNPYLKGWHYTYSETLRMQAVHIRHHGLQVEDLAQLVR